MIRFALLLIVGIFLMSTGCGEDDNTSDCIEERINEFKERHIDRSFTMINTFELGSEKYYVFDSGVAFDATAEVVNADCDVVCTYGGLRMSNSDCDLYQEGINRAVTEWEGGQ